MSKVMWLMLLLMLPIFSYGQNKIIRDTRTNEVVEVWRQEGNRTYVTDRFNNPGYTRYRDGNMVILRDTTTNHDFAEEDYE